MMADSYKLGNQGAWRNRISGYDNVDPEQLLANPRNFRVHPKFQQDALSGALDEIGWIDDVIVNQQSGNIIDGHLRVTLALRNGEPSVPVKYVDLSENEEHLALATFDPITAMATHDVEILDELLHDVNTGDEHLQQMLADMAEDAGLYPDAGEPVDAEPQVDRAEELREQWGVDTGQLWLLDSGKGQPHRLICGDCTDADVVARVMGGERADVGLHDPPYGVKMDKGFSGKAAFAGKGKPIPRRQYSDDWDNEPPEDFSMILENSVQVILWGGNNFADKLPASSHWLVWDKCNTMPTYGDCELAWTNIDRKSIKKYEFEYNGLIGKEKERFHPTQKPIGLFVKVLSDYTDEGDTVADFFLGSGSTLLACEQLNRQCRAIEISAAYVAVVLQRFTDATGTQPERMD